MFGRKRIETATETATLPNSPALMWSDPFGRVATRCAQAILVLIIAIAVVFTTIQLKLVVIPVLIALILASALRPFVRILERRMPPLIAAIVALLLGSVAFGGIVAIAVVGVQSQFDSLQSSVTDGIDQVVDFINNGPIPISAQQIDDARTAGLDFLTSSQFGSGAIAGVSVAAELVAGTVLGLFVLFYFLKDGPLIWSFLIKPFRAQTHARARRAGNDAVDTLGGYVRGTAIVASVDAVLIGVALWILQVPLALPLAIVVFVGAFIPIVGATAAGIIAALVALVTVDVSAAIWVTVVVIAVNQLEGNLLSPVVLGRSLRLNGLVVLLALTAGTILGGIIGTLLSIPLTAVAWTIIKSWSDPIVEEPGIDGTQRARDRQFSREAARR